MAESAQLALDGESAWGAVAGLPRLRFPRPLSEPDVRLSSHPALHRVHAAGSMISVGQADGIVVPLQRYRVTGTEEMVNSSISSMTIGRQP